MRKIKFSPSLMCARLDHLQETVKKLEREEIDFLHFDIMDGHFVPNFSIGPDLMKGLQKCTQIPFDAHLMIYNPEKFIDRFIDCGAKLITVHFEATHSLLKVLERIRKEGKKVGVALKPNTSIDCLDPVLAYCDVILLMMVEPGFAGQKLLPSMIEKIRLTRDMLEKKGLKTEIEVDGNVSFENIPRMAKAGADIFVLGSSSLFSSYADLEKNLKRLLKIKKQLGY